MEIQSTIRAYQKVLKSFRFTQPATFSEDFAQKRFLKKLQEPDPTVTARLHSECWDRWLETDKGLPCLRNRTLLPEWYRAREILHRVLGEYRDGSVRFPRGSEFFPTRGRNSLEARLCQSAWSCTHDNFTAFAKLCYSHKGLRRSVRRRYDTWYRRSGFDESRQQSDRILYDYFSRGDNVGFNIFSWKLSRIVTLVRGSRFSTVPKNNETSRPINIEPFGNILTQSSIGEGIKGALIQSLGLDLNGLADIHKVRITDPNVATIDLRDASDSVSLDLCRFLLPAWFFEKIEHSRSSLVLHDDEYFVTKKVSSMGNGFTFELMSLILNCIVRTLDEKGTVFGDDIIIDKKHAPRLIELLQDVGFSVNSEKSFLSGPFRESCGGNYHDVEGYVKSFDFTWPENIHDCQIALAKAYYLSDYPSFKKLHIALSRSTPHALHGGPCRSFKSTDCTELTGSDDGLSPLFPPFFVTEKVPRPLRVRGKARESLRHLSYDPDDFYVVTGFRFVEALRSPSFKNLSPHRHWAKYEMYLHGGMVVKDVLKGEGQWVSQMTVSSGDNHFRVSSLKH